MRVNLERDALAEAVAWTARVLPGRPVLPVLSGLLLQAQPGSLTISCFDYEVSARIAADAEVAEPGTALVPGRLLAEITRSLPPLGVEIAQRADDLTLTCGEAAFSLVMLPLGEYPRLPELPRPAGTVDGGMIAAAISQVTPSASRDDTLPVLTGVNMEIDGGMITLVATDRYRLAVRELAWQPERPGTRCTLLVPARTLAEAARMTAPGVPVQIMVGAEQAPGGAAAGASRGPDTVIGFSCGGRRLTTRLLGTEYIRYASRFPREFGSCAEMPAARLAEAVRRVALVAERGSSVRLSFGGGTVTIEAGTKGQARAREIVAAEFSGDESVIAFSPQYLLDGLSAALTAAAAAGQQRDGVPANPEVPAADAARVRLQFTSPAKPALITGHAGPGDEGAPEFRYLLVPLRALQAT